MKRKLGVAILVLATALVGTPEAVTQFRDLNAALCRWASHSFGGSLLVYADGASERALPDRYDYHEVAPVVRPSALDQSASGYGLMASLSTAPAVERAPAASCPVQAQAARRAAPAVIAAATRPQRVSAPRVAAPVARRVERDAAAAEIARQFERAVSLTTKALDGKLRGLKFEYKNDSAAAGKLKALRLKAVTEALKERRASAPAVRVVSFARELPAPTPLPALELLAPALPPYAELARRENEEEARPGPAPDGAKRRDPRARKNARPDAPRTLEPRQFDVAPFVIMASTQTEATGFNCDSGGNDR
ncbi:MAG TPA: hypothetical protein VF546_01640 [Pyrinomonadaceae bacterium]|jgi:hypothetical protein